MMLFGFVGAVHADPKAEYDACLADCSNFEIPYSDGMFQCEKECIDDYHEATGQGQGLFKPGPGNASVEQETQTAGYCHPIFGCTGLKPEDDSEESGWIETKPTDEPIFIAQPTGNGGFIPPPQAVGSCEIQCRGVREDDYGKCMSDCQNSNKASAIDWLNENVSTPERAYELFGTQTASTICVNLLFTPNFCVTFSTSSADGAVEEQADPLIESPTQTAFFSCTPAASKCCVGPWCWSNKAHADDQEIDDGIDGIEESSTMLSGTFDTEPTTLIAGALEVCKFNCDGPYKPGSYQHQACYDECEKEVGGQASAEQPTDEPIITADLSVCHFTCDNYHEQGSETHQSCYSTCEKNYPQASVEPTTLIASINSCEHCAKEDGHAQQDCYDTCEAAQQSSAAEQPTMLAGYVCDAVYCCSHTHCWPNKAHLEVEENENVDGGEASPMMTASSNAVAACIWWKCDGPYKPGSAQHNACSDECEKDYGSQASADQPTTLIASINSCEHCAKEDGHAQKDCYDTCKAAQQSSAAEQPTMLAEGGCYVNDQGEEVCYGENGEILGAVEQSTMMARINCDKNGVCTSPGQPKQRAGAEPTTMLAGSALNQCKWQCDEYQDGSAACYETCEKHHGGQASLEEKTMIADIRIGDPKPICGTDAWACFNGTDDESPAIRDVGIFGVFASNHGCFHPSCD